MKLTEVDNWKIFFIELVVSLVLQKADGLATTTTTQQHNFSLKPKSSSLERSGRMSATASSGGASGGGSSINHSLGKGIAANILAEIRSLDDQLKCFPKLLCTIYQDDSISRQGFLNATELAVAYIKLLKAVYYQSPTAATSTTTMAPKKRPIIQIFEIPMGLITAATYARKGQLKNSRPSDDMDDDYPYLRSPPMNYDRRYHRYGGNGNEDYSTEEYDDRPIGRDDDDDDDDGREYLREKLAMSQLMQDLIEEDKAELRGGDDNDDSETDNARAGISPVLSSILPFGAGSLRRKRSHEPKVSNSGGTSARTGSQRTESVSRRRQRQQLYSDSVLQKRNPFWKAVATWRKLKRKSQCGEMYKQCPFEAWEIVRMLDLVKDQSRILSAYLKLTVDKARPVRKRL